MRHTQQAILVDWPNAPGAIYYPAAQRAVAYLHRDRVGKNDFKRCGAVSFARWCAGHYRINRGGCVRANVCLEKKKQKQKTETYALDRV